LRILEEAWASGEVRAGTVIAEATSGNTGIAFAALGRALGHPVRIFMPDWMSRERVLLIQSLGAVIVPVSAGEAASSAASRAPTASRWSPTSTSSCRTSSRTPPTCARTPRAPGPSSCTRCAAPAPSRAPSSPASAPAAR
jgi:hypothetical protein